MNDEVQTALETTEMLYTELVSIANDIVKPYVKDLNDIIDEASQYVDTMSIEQIRYCILQISLQSFKFGDIKEKTTLLSACAETLRKEAYAKQFNRAEGSVAAKESTAIIQTSSQTVAEMIYDLVASMLKTKLDEAHRCVDALKSVLMSRMSEQKIMASFSEGE